MFDVGISEKAFALYFANCYPGSRGERLKEAWSFVRRIRGGMSSTDMAIADELGICPSCLKGGYLFANGGAILKCLSCGEEWIVFDNKR